MFGQLQDLIYFRQVVICGSVTQAALALGVPKSKVSRRLQALESHLGYALLIRTTRKITLTVQGHHLYQHIDPLLSGLADVEHLMAQSYHQPQGDLQLAMPSALDSELFLNILAEFARYYPQICLKIRHHEQGVLKWSHDLDLALVMHDLPLPNSDLVARPLMSLPQVFVASRAWVQRAGTEVCRIDRWAEYECITGLSETQWPLRGEAETFSVPIERVALAADSFKTQLQGALFGLGIARMPRAMCEVPLRQGALIALQCEAQPVALTLSVLSQSKRLPFKARLLIDFFQDQLGRRSSGLFD